MDQKNTLENLIERIKDKQEDVVPCSKADVRKIEKKFSVNLPEEYLKFLYSMGRNAGSYMKGSSCFYPEILELRGWAQESLQQNEFKPLPDDAFVFWMHQGYQFAFFKLSDGNNPSVYFFYEGKTKGEFEKKENSIADFFHKQIPF